MMSTISSNTRMKQDPLGSLNKHIEKPLRYVGGELNAVVKKNCKASFLLAFPDIYEIGMSHFGSRILYDVVNSAPDYCMERVYMPWKDAYGAMKLGAYPLVSLESLKKASEFDAVGFSLQHELAYTNVLAMLELGGIELFADKRKENAPIIIAGGGAVYNPAPMKRFIDVFVIGEAEEVILDIMQVLAGTKDRKERLNGLSRLDGLYVPSIHGKEKIIKKLLIKDLNDSPIVKRPLVPYLDLIHDRLTYEIQRGCNRGCRFCQAGTIYRPVRQRSAEEIVEHIEKDIASTGYRDIGFLSLNACDYLPLLKMVGFLTDRFKESGVYLSLPSLRIESIGDEFLNVFAKLPKVGFTIAPEAGSERLRKVINKDISDDEILNTIETVSGLGWNSIKTYFMAGLPTEEDTDIEAIVDLSFRMLKKLKGPRSRFTVSVSNFVPKPQTPFQWERQLPWELFDEKISNLTKKIRHKNVSLKWGDPKMSEVEGVLARGDERIGELIYRVYKKGEKFSGWGGEFDHSKWMDTMKELGLDKLDHLSERDVDAELPWSNISSGVDVSWLKKERQAAYEVKETGHCTFGKCVGCGICQAYDVKNIVAKDCSVRDIGPIKEHKVEKKHKFRCLYSKIGKFKWMGHFELMSAVEKAMLRADIPVTVSQGFKPACALSFSPPVGLGTESCSELVDVLLYDDVPENEFISRMNEQLPEELSFKKVWRLPVSSTSLYQDINTASWRVRVNNFDGDVGKVDRSMSGKVTEKEKNGKIKRTELGDFVKTIDVKEQDGSLIIDFEILFINGKTVRPLEVVRAMLPDVGEEQLVFTRRGVSINGIYIGD